MKEKSLGYDPRSSVAQVGNGECDHAWIPGGDWGPKHGHPWSSQDRYCILCGLEGCEALWPDDLVIFLTAEPHEGTEWDKPSYLVPGSWWKLARRLPIRITSPALQRGAPKPEAGETP